VELPFVAEGVEGGDVVQILVREGDQVTEGQALLELETDKATIQVPAPSAGKVAKVLVKSGDHLKVGQALMELDGDGAQPAQQTDSAKKTKKEAPAAPAQPQAADKKSATEKEPAPSPQPPPAVEAAHAKAVEEKEQPPAQETDSAEETEKEASAPAQQKATDKKSTTDKKSAPAKAPTPSPQPQPAVEAADENAGEEEKQSPAQPANPEPQAQEPPSGEPSAREVPAGPGVAAPPSVRRLARELGVDLTQVKGSEAGGRITAEDVKTYVRERTRRSGAPTGKDGQDKGSNVFTTMYGNERREAISSLRRKIAATVTQAWTTIPHVHQFQEADVTDLMALHKRYAPQFKQKGATLTLTSLFLKAVTHALKLYPQFNATIDLTNGEVIYKDYYNIGVAVETPAGLIVPVVHRVDEKDLLHISLEIADLAERTRTRQIKLEELRGATFTVSNMGGLNAGPFMPIIMPPQVAILGVGKGRRVPVYRDGQLVPRVMLPLCVAYDHRLIDGADGARFTNEIVKVLEDFQAMSMGL
ncbi:MAG: 2-oxo acid dehydrogenase subunit E2, partial [Nitrospira sp.]|nr:2-oxo acid dehydrogenase subunit E2 [Nitrospira sp.]